MQVIYAGLDKKVSAIDKTNGQSILVD